MRVFVTILIVFYSSICFSQTGCCPYIQSCIPIPANPTTTDIIKIATHTATPALGNKISYSYFLQNDTIYINGCFFSGVLTAVPSYYDTVTIGTLQQGTYTIYYTAIQSSDTGICIYIDSSIMITPLHVFNANEVENVPKLKKCFIYPNPASTYINLTSSIDIDAIEIQSILGQRLLDKKYKRNDAIDVSNFKRGYYILTVFSNGKSEHVTFIKN